MTRLFYTAFMAFIAILFLASCNTSSFTTANNMRNMYGTVYMRDGRQLQGEITVSLEGGIGSRDFVRFTQKNSSKKEKIYIEDMEGFSLGNDYYAAKKVDMGLFGGDRMLFLKRLTRENSRIHLYELMRQRRSSNGNGPSYTTIDYDFYITLPQHDRYTAWSIDGRNVVPNFEDKMSEYVKDCSELAEKIKRKDKGYFYAKISFFDRKRINTVLNIIDDYNACR